MIDAQKLLQNEQQLAELVTRVTKFIRYAGSRNRTADLRITSALLYHLS